MSVSYKKLWKLLIDKDMKKKDLCEKAGISPASVTKMGRNGHVTTEILVKICAALDCGIEDIIEIVPDEKQPSNKAEGQRGSFFDLRMKQRNVRRYVTLLLLFALVWQPPESRLSFR